MTTPDQPQPQSAAGGSPAPLADWGTRVLGALIDALPFIILSVLTLWSDFLSWLVGLAGIAYTIYLGYMEGVTGQTPGKAIMGLRLVDQQGEVVGSGPGIGRKVAHVVDSLICLLGWLLPLVDSNRQTIADKLLQTYVVSGVEKRPFAVELWTQPPQEGGVAPGSGTDPGGPPSEEPPEGHSPQD